MVRVSRHYNQTLSFGRKSEFTKALINSSVHAIRIRSGVAGLSRGNQSVQPTSARAAIMASFMAKKTDEARKNGGSPTAFDEWMALSFGAPCQHSQERHDSVSQQTSQSTKY